MKHTMKAIVATLLLMLTSLTAQGATVTIEDGLTHGNITKEVSGTKVTLTAAPDAGYLLCFDDLSVKAYVDGGKAEGRTRGLIPMYTIDVANNGDGTYTFTMPTEGYDVYVTAVFCQAIVTLPAGPFTYAGSPITPAPTVECNGTTLTSGTDYTVGYTNNVNVGTNTATVTVTGGGKYFGTATATFSISPKGVNPNPDSDSGEGKISIAVNPTSFIYNGADQKPAITVKDGEDENATVIDPSEYTVSYKNSKGETVEETKDVDTYTLVIANKEGGNYVVDGTATFDITQKALTITAKEQSVTYGTAITEGTDQVRAEGLVTGHTLTSVTLTQSTTSVTTSGTITPSAATVKSGDDDVTANYDITYNTGTLIVNASTAASAVVTANDRTYDGSTQPLVTIGAITNGATGTAADVVFYESATSTIPLTSIPEGTNAGTYEVYYEVTPDGDHTAPARAKVTVIISPIDAIVVTITGHNSTAVYDGKEHSVSGYDVSINNTLYKESDFTFSGTATAARTDAGTTDMGLDASQFTNTNANFNVTFNVTDGFVTVSPKVVNPNPDSDNGEGKISIAVTPTSFIYNGADQKPDITVKDGEDENATVIDPSEYTVSYKNSKGETVEETKDVDTYTLVIANKEGGNYVVDGSATYDITSKALTITAKGKTISYGSEASDNGVEYSGFAEGENEMTEGVFSGTLTYQYNKQEDGKGEAYTKDSPVGTYYIIPSGLTSKNYAITYKAGILTVSDKVIVIGGGDDADADAMISVEPAEFIYNGKDQKPTVTITLKDGNKVVPADEYVVKYKDADGNEMSETKGAGTYTLEVGSKEGADYAFSGKTTSNYTIKPKTLTVTADAKTKNVGEDDPEFTYTYDGFVEGDEDVFSGALARDEGEEAGTYAIMLGTLSAGKNYAIVYKGANLTIIAPETPPVETTYSISVLKTEGGVAHTSLLQAKQGQQVNIVVMPEADYDLSSVAVINNSTREVFAPFITHDEKGNVFWTFYMPAADVTVVATFMKQNDESKQNIFILNNLYGEVVSHLLYAELGQQVNLETRVKNGYKNTVLDNLIVINDKGEQLQTFYLVDPKEGPVHLFFMKGEKAYVYNTFKGTNGIVDETKPLRLDGYLMYLLSEQYSDFVKTTEGVEGVQLAMSYLANILANFNSDGELSVDQGPEDMNIALLNLLSGWKVKIDFTGIIQLLNPEILGLADGATLTSGQVYELLTPGNLKLLLNSSYGPLLIKAITVIVPEDPTAINGLKADKAAGDIYDLRGRKVDMNTLRKGVYIRNGKKVVIK